MAEDGTLSWSNNGGLPNPQSINLRGPQGAPGADAPQIDDTVASAEHPWSGAKVEVEVSALRKAILSGTKENAAYHLGLYRDENGELCEVEGDV